MPEAKAVAQADAGSINSSTLLSQYRSIFPVAARLLLASLLVPAYLLLCANPWLVEEDHWRSTWHIQWQQGPLAIALVACCCTAAAYLKVRRQVFLVDFACYTPPSHLHVSLKRFMRGAVDCGFYTDDSLDFQERISQRNGLGHATSFPPSLHHEPPICNMITAREEAEMVLFGSVKEALEKAGWRPREVDILVVNCSLFNPTPSLSAMIINHFKMRSDILSYNLAGMGCSAGVIAIGLAQRLLAGEPNSRALVVSTENITLNWYSGNDRSMLIPNTLFRMGGAAILLSNRPADSLRAKYSLEHIVRVHLGADDAAYRCVYQHPDKAGKIGVELNRDLVKVAGRALAHNLTKLGPKVLPWSEKLLYAANWVARKTVGCKEYVPDFKQAFDHFCLHAGGRGVIEGIGGQLGLSQAQLEPSSSTLYWYGNTSSSSLWYALSYIESRQTVRRGDRVWQVGFGSGFKCNSAVWRALRTINSQHKAWAHLAAPTQQQGSTVDSAAAEQVAAGAKAEQAPVKSQLLNGHRNEENQDPQVHAKSMGNGVHFNGYSGSSSEAGSDAVGRPNGFMPKAEPNTLEGKVPKAGHLKEDESGSGEIKAHNESVNGKHSMAVL